MREKKLPSQTLSDFQQYLLSRKLVPEKSVTFYAYWANRYLTFSKRLKNADAAEALRRFLEGWRIWGRWFKCNLSIPPPFIEKIAGGSIPINQGGRDYHVKLHFHLRPPLSTLT